MYGAAVFIGLVGGIGLAVQLNPAAFFFPIFAALFIWFTRQWVVGLKDPSKNYVELRPQGMRVTVHWALRPWSVDFKYRSIDEIAMGAEHGYSLVWRWPMMYGGWGDPHVDILLNHGRVLYSVVGGFIPWLKVLHLPLQDPDLFVGELRSKLNRLEHG
jgi:hypothetical protein